ncbi:MAG: plastocyanin/azurin family copper-binding protein [Ignavibacteriaceae bacterium]|nr:plastocyanin/azurin family copper-binding protein [Ignavibacteriaceae bacterium]
MSIYIDKDENKDGIDRRGFLKCMAWAGTGVLWIMQGGVLKSFGMSQLVDMNTGKLKSGIKIPKSDFTFVQISDSHIGFSKEANPDVITTLQAAITKINGMPDAPEFTVHTGDLSHLSKADEFDTLDQLLKGAKTGKIFYVPGEHDVLNDDGKQYLDRYGKGTMGNGWYSFDLHGVHFMGLVNVVNMKAGGLGRLGNDQLEWFEKDIKGLKDSTPVVVFAHIPLWNVYPEWGWGTDDSAQVLSSLKRFGSVTVLNGHIHQIMQKIEGNITFHTAMSTAFPQPKPGTAPGPGPMKVPDDKLRSLLGITDVNYLEQDHTLAVTDTPLLFAAATGDQMKEHKKNNGTLGGENQVTIDNFSFNPKELTVAAGTKVTWVNHDDVPHTVVSTDKSFKSDALDTNDQYSHTFSQTGVYEYYCSVHPRMTGKIIVK